MGKVTAIGEHPQSLARHWTPLQTLKDTAKAIENGEIDPERLFLIGLSDSDGTYQTMYRFSNINVPEAVALLEAVKNILCRELIPDD